MGPGLLNILMAWMEGELQSRLQASLSNGDISGLLTAQDDRVRKARRPSVTGKGAAMVSADRITSGCNLPATLTRLLGPRYEDWKGSRGPRRARIFKNSVPSWPGLGRPHPNASPANTSAAACGQGSLPPWPPPLLLLHGLLASASALLHPPMYCFLQSTYFIIKIILL